MTAGERCCLGLFFLGMVLFFCVRLAAQQGTETSAQSGNFKIAIKVNSVLVPVVVRDANGRAVGGLKREDFHLFDQDKPRDISGFTIQRRMVDQNRAPTVEAGVASSATNNAAAIPAAPASAAQRFIVFLFDDMHLAPAELLRIKNVATKMLAESLDDSDIAAVVTTSGSNSGLTRDRATLETAVKKVATHPILQTDSRACPNIDVYQADLIVNKHNDRALQLAEVDYAACAHAGGDDNAGGANGSGMRVAVGAGMGERMVRSAAAQVLEVGERDVTVTLSTVKQLIAKMGTLPGQRSIILISPGFLTITPNAMREKSDVLDLAARSNVVISSLDARGLYTTNVDASERGGNSTLDLMTGQHAQYQSDSMNLSEDVMAEFANGTGGTFFHNSNDLEGGFKNLTQTPEYVYLLEISLDGVPLDGTYHRLKVKVDRSGLQLYARRGYFVPKVDRADARPAAPTPTAAPEPPKTQQPPAPAVAVTTPPVAEPRRKDPEKKAKSSSDFWYPLDVDSPVRSDVSSSPCVLSDALEKSAARAEDLVANLQNFTAQEKIEYRSLRGANTVLEHGAGMFDYTVVFQQSMGGFAVQEGRTPEKGSQAFPASRQDVGLPTLALIFLSNFQSEYEMKCDGVAEWKGQRAWIVHFQQRSDRTSHTVLFRAKDVAYPAKLKGRAWIVQDAGSDTGEVIHVETSLMEAIPAANVRRMYLSIDYAPVQFRTQDVRIWLPQAVDAYGDFGDHRTIINHTFTNFLLYSVRTDDTVGKPTVH